MTSESLDQSDMDQLRARPEAANMTSTDEETVDPVTPAALQGSGGMQPSMSGDSVQINPMPVQHTEEEYMRGVPAGDTVIYRVHPTWADRVRGRPAETEPTEDEQLQQQQGMGHQGRQVLPHDQLQQSTSQRHQHGPQGGQELNVQQLMARLQQLEGLAEQVEDLQQQLGEGRRQVNELQKGRDTGQVEQGTARLQGSGVEPSTSQQPASPVHSEFSDLASPNLGRTTFRPSSRPQLLQERQHCLAQMEHSRHRQLQLQQSMQEQQDELQQQVAEMQQQAHQAAEQQRQNLKVKRDQLEQQLRGAAADAATAVAD